MSGWCRPGTTLGDFILDLESRDPGLPVRFDDGRAPGKFLSYRGYYEDLALDSDEPREVKVRDLLREARAVVGSVLMGYKGGEYRMDLDTDLWASDYGEASGRGIAAVVVRNGVATIKTREVE